jgi:hypothetical protein
MSTVFKKTKEDFVCEHCGKPVVGNGYTNHCPECLWSKHVDVNPGDRAATCLGLMEPVGVTIDQAAVPEAAGYSADFVIVIGKDRPSTTSSN